MTYILPLLAAVLGGWMLFDGIHVLQHGKYFGPARPGPWVWLPERLGLDPFAFGPLFVVLGVVWLLCAAGYLYDPQAARIWLTGVAVLSLWYIPPGTLVALLVLRSLWF